MELIHFLPGPQETALEHSEVVVEEQKVTLDPLTYLLLHHLVVKVDLVVEQEQIYRDLPTLLD